MTARIRRASPPVACGHCTDRRDCGTCSTAAHERAFEHAKACAKAAMYGVPFDGSEEAQRRSVDAEDAQRGHRILRENGIALDLVRAPRLGTIACIACGLKASSPLDVSCRNLRCPGRRVRCELPEVRGR